MFNYEKALARNVRKHIKEEHKHMKHAMQKQYEYKCKPFEWSIPYKPRLGIFKLKRRSEVTFNPNTIEAHSYGHWCFVKVIKGKVVFNDYQYSNTTRRHQWDIRQLLRELNIKIDLEVNQYESLSQGLNGSVKTLQQSIAQNEIVMARKGARETTKKSSTQAIKHCNAEIKVLKSLGAQVESSRLEQLRIQESRNEVYRLEQVKRKREQWKLDNHTEIQTKKFNKDFDKLLTGEAK